MMDDIVRDLPEVAARAEGIERESDEIVEPRPMAVGAVQGIVRNAEADPSDPDAHHDRERQHRRRAKVIRQDHAVRRDDQGDEGDALDDHRGVGFRGEPAAREVLGHPRFHLAHRLSGRVTRVVLGEANRCVRGSQLATWATVVDNRGLYANSWSRVLSIARASRARSKYRRRGSRRWKAMPSSMDAGKRSWYSSRNS